MSPISSSDIYKSPISSSDICMSPISSSDIYLLLGPGYGLVPLCEAGAPGEHGRAHHHAAQGEVLHGEHPRLLQLDRQDRPGQVTPGQTSFREPFLRPFYSTLSKSAYTFLAPCDTFLAPCDTFLAPCDTFLAQCDPLLAHYPKVPIPSWHHVHLPGTMWHLSGTVWHLPCTM